MKKILYLTIMLLLVIGTIGYTLNEADASDVSTADQKQYALDKPDATSYLYLMSDSGQLIREIQVKGRIVEYYSGTNMIKIYWVDVNGEYGDWNGKYHRSSVPLFFTFRPTLEDL